jgi:hypothetical protein
VPLRLHWSDTVSLQAIPSLHQGGRYYKATLIADAGATALHLNLQSLQLPNFWRQARVNLSGCRLDSTLDHKAGYPKTSRLACSYEVRPHNRLIPTLRGKLGATVGLKPVSPRAFALDATLDENSSGSFLDSTVKGKAAATMEAGALVSPTVHLNASLAIPRFQAWRKFWAGTLLSVPAPLHVLEGPIHATLTLDNTSREAAAGKFHLQTDLKSPNQSLVLAADTAIHLDIPAKRHPGALDLDNKVVLQDVRLEAPPLNLGAPPQFLPDKRFVAASSSGRSELPPEEGTAQAGALPVHWKLQVVTQKPVEVVTNLLEHPVPVALNLQMSDSNSMHGDVQVLPMDLKVFQKKAHIDHVRVTYSEGSKVGQLDGVIVDHTPEVTIRLLLLGSTESPRVDFESDPPLSRQQIISILLFNKSLSELSEEEADSTQSMSQALSEGAFGLFSLFFLSSTPIQSVSYDPVSQNYTARVSLGAKTTLSVGSNFDNSRRFGLRRQLGGRWAVTTELRELQDEPDVVMTLVEWFQRF